MPIFACIKEDFVCIESLGVHLDGCGTELKTASEVFRSTENAIFVLI